MKNIFSEQLPEQLGELISALKSSLKDLVELSKVEREAIVTFDLKAITQTQTYKQRVLTKLSSLDRTKQRLIKEATVDLNSIDSNRSNPSLSDLVQHYCDEETAELLAKELSCIKSISQAAEEFNKYQKEYIDYSLNTVRAMMQIISTAKGSQEIAGSDSLLGATTISRSY